MKFIVNLLVTILILHINGENDRKHLNILVLYESLCPDSINFFQTQLKPYYGYIKDYVNIELVPFGKSHSYNNGLHFKCQHGPPECKGNLIQSCGLENLKDSQDKQVDFAICQMDFSNDPSGVSCARPFGIVGDLHKCVKSKLGNDLQLNAEFITNLYSPSFVPTIIYNGVFNQQLQDKSQTYFLEVVCGLLKEYGQYVYESELQNICNKYQ